MALHPTAAQSLFVTRKTPLMRYVAYSLVAHVVLVAAAYFYGRLFQGPLVDLDQKPIHASLVRLGTPRDEKLLPRKEEELPPPPKAVEAAPEPPKPVPETPTVLLPGVKPTETKKTKVDGSKTSQENRKALFNAFGKAAKSTAHDVEGAADGDRNGNSATQEGPRYYGELTERVKRSYDLPSTISDAERIHLRARVFIAISESGQLLKAKVVKSSGNDLFDSAIIAAVKRSAPFGPPPPELRATLARTGVTLEFSP